MNFTRLAIFALVSVLYFLPSLVHGETFITEFDIIEDTTWKKEGSPYVLQSSVMVHEDATLTIEPGVVIKFDLGYVRLNVFGEFIAKGTVDEPIHFTSLYNSSVGGNTVGDEEVSPYDYLDLNRWGIDIRSKNLRPAIHNTTFSYSGGFGAALVMYSPLGADLENVTFDTVTYALLGVDGDISIRNSQARNIKEGAFLFFDGSKATIASTSINSVHLDDAIGIYDSVPIDINQVHITNAHQAIGVYGNGEVKVSNSKIKENGIGVGVYTYDSIPSLRVGKNAIENNHIYGAVNYSDSVVDLKNNWWGSASGPLSEDNLLGEGNIALGNVGYEPWLQFDPSEDKLECCSSVMFLPGLQASRLYKDGLFGINKLWEPNRRDDVRKLFLDDSGKSLEDGIYADGVIDSAYKPLGIGVYEQLIQTMDTMVQNDDLNQWKMFPYDWRFGYDEIIEEYNLVSEIEQLANESQTGKVSIVAHSNGGLIAKKLAIELERLGKIDLLERVILVAVPQLGTPSAVAALLHGTDTSIAGGSFLSQDVGRKLGENMPSAYNLLPSDDLFEKIDESIVTFDDSLNTISNLNQFYGDTIESKDELSNYLLGLDGREKPSNLALHLPNVLNPDLHAQSVIAHAISDKWEFPESVEVIQIGGWGAATLGGLTYAAMDVCTPLPHSVNCTLSVNYVPKITYDGDGTVITQSAVSEEGEILYLNLSKYNREHLKNSSHAFIFEIDEVNNFIKNTVLKKESDLKYLTKEKPTETKKRTDIIMHSPVAIHILDKDGNHTGLSDDPGDLGKYEEKIPNSYYAEFGETKYVSGENLEELKIKGEGEGVFTLEIFKYENDELVASSTFNTILTTEHMNGSLSLVSSTTELVLDIDGDGVTDVVLNEAEEGDIKTRLRILRKTVEVMNVDENKKKQLIKRIDKFIESKKVKIKKLKKLNVKYPLPYIEQLITELEAD